MTVQALRRGRPEVLADLLDRYGRDMQAVISRRGRWIDPRRAPRRPIRDLVAGWHRTRLRSPDRAERRLRRARRPGDGRGRQRRRGRSAEGRRQDRESERVRHRLGDELRRGSRDCGVRDIGRTARQALSTQPSGRNGHSAIDRRHLARPTGIGRALATYEIPIEGRDEWLAAARRQAGKPAAPPDEPQTAGSGWSLRSSRPDR